MLGFVSIIVGFISSNARMIFKFSVLLAFLGALTAFSIWFWSFMGDVYNIIYNNFSSFNNVLSNSNTSISCLFSILGIDTFLNSAFSMIYTAVLFWVTAVGYVITYRLGSRVYDGIFKAL